MDGADASLYDQISEHISSAFPDLQKRTAEPDQVIASRFVWRDPKLIPVRKFLYGRHYIRRFISATVAPGGLGKSSLALTEAACMVSGKPELRKQVKGPLRVWYWNGEDPYEEMERRFHAICIKHGFTRDDGFEQRLWLDSGRDSPIRLAEQTSNGTMLVDLVLSDLEQQIGDNGIDSLIIDPFVSSHAVPENDNVAINTVAKAVARIADRTNCAIELVHHVRKSRDGDETQAEDARGASALIDACRSVRTLSRMGKDTALEVGITEKDRKRFFYVVAGKANLAPPSDPDWHELVGVSLENGDPLEEPDEVGVVVTWEAPTIWKGVSTQDVYRVQSAVSDGPEPGKKWHANVRSPTWVGRPVAATLAMNINDDGAKKRIQAMLRSWLQSGAFVEIEELDAHRKARSFVIVGKWIEPGSL